MTHPNEQTHRTDHQKYKTINLRQNWYRDLWLFLVTVAVAIGFNQFHITTNEIKEGRTSAVDANVEARYSDCRGGNETRNALRKQVEQGRIERPFLLKLLPQLNTPSVIELLNKNEKEELEGFVPRNCIEYAKESLPGHHKRYTFRISG